jgi:hypothetical protein
MVGVLLVPHAVSYFVNVAERNVLTLHLENVLGWLLRLVGRDLEMRFSPTMAAYVHAAVKMNLPSSLLTTSTTMVTSNVSFVSKKVMVRPVLVTMFGLGITTSLLTYKSYVTTVIGPSTS